MKICMVAEGCYPYVVGGVSGWINNLITSFPEHEFIVSCISFGLNIEALKELTYIDVVKMMITTRKREKENKNSKQSS